MKDAAMYRRKSVQSAGNITTQLISHTDTHGSVVLVSSLAKLFVIFTGVSVFLDDTDFEQQQQQKKNRNKMA